MTAVAETTDRVRAVLAAVADPGNAGRSRRAIARMLDEHESFVRRVLAASHGEGMTKETDFTIEDIRLDALTIDTEGIQPREQSNESSVAGYKDQYIDGRDLGEIAVYRDPTDPTLLRLADGHQRVEAAKQAGRDSLKAKVYAGDRTQCLIFALSANLKHGTQLTLGDKKKSLRLALADPVIAGKSDRSIAEICGLSDKTIANARREQLCGDSAVGQPEMREGRDGKLRPATTSRPAATTSANNKPSSTPALDATRRERANGQTVMVETAPVESSGDNTPPADNPFDPKPEPDGEWLTGFRIRSELSDRCRAKFDLDAVAWRRITGHERFKEFHDLVKRHTPPTDASGYSSKIRWVLRFKGPDRWLLCSKCGGKGHGETAAPCENCSGDGYKPHT